MLVVKDFVTCKKSLKASIAFRRLVNKVFKPTRPQLLIGYLERPDAQIFKARFILREKALRKKIQALFEKFRVSAVSSEKISRGIYAEDDDPVILFLRRRFSV